MNFHNHLYFFFIVYFINSIHNFFIKRFILLFFGIIYDYHYENLEVPLNFPNLAFFSIKSLDSHINQICFSTIFPFAYATRFS